MVLKFMGSFGVSLPVIALNNGFLGAVSRIGKRTITARQVLSTSATGIKFGDPVVIIPNNAGGGDTIMSVADYIAAGNAFGSSNFAGVGVREVKTQLSYSSLATIPATLVGIYVPGEIAEMLEEGSICVAINNGTPKSQGAVFVRVSLDAAISAGVVGGFEAVTDPNPVSTTMGTTSGSAAITVASATGITVGSIATGTGIPTGASVISVVGTTVTLSANATATAASGVAVTFSHTVQLPSNVVFRTGNLDSNNVAEITLLNRQAA
jgi:hypothetical protein